jgi:lipopolysaccharide/colanic/teichoic acid biosynthesis glycosyltransferase
MDGMSKMKVSLIAKTLTFTAFLCGVLSFIPMTVAQGGISYVAPLNSETLSAQQIDNVSIAAVSPEFSASHQRSKSRAPEPGTIVLFFSGLMGMIVHVARRSFRAAKRALDYVIAGTAIVLTAPLMLLIALLVKLTSNGPAIYSQQRVGKNGKTFSILKFRSMSVDAEKGTGAVWAKKNDPRVTPLGVFLRKSHLDELPQLFNVLKGEMSIVGPRPERPEMVKTLKETISDYEKRLQVLPGITGLAQVMHRYDETIADVKAKVKYDLLYIKKMCWMAEMRIVALTCVVMITGRSIR